MRLQINGYTNIEYIHDRNSKSELISVAAAQIRINEWQILEIEKGSSRLYHIAQALRLICDQIDIVVDILGHQEVHANIIFVELLLLQTILERPSEQALGELSNIGLLKARHGVVQHRCCGVAAFPGDSERILIISHCVGVLDVIDGLEELATHCRGTTLINTTTEFAWEQQEVSGLDVAGTHLVHYSAQCSIATTASAVFLLDVTEAVHAMLTLLFFCFELCADGARFYGLHKSIFGKGVSSFYSYHTKYARSLLRKNALAQTESAPQSFSILMDRKRKTQPEVEDKAPDEYAKKRASIAGMIAMLF